MTQRDTRIDNDGFCAPILWGVKLGYSIAAIAEGLELDEPLVRAVIESRSGVRFPVARTYYRVEPDRSDAPYLAWLRQHVGAVATRRAIAGASTG